MFVNIEAILPRIDFQSITSKELLLISILTLPSTLHSVTSPRAPLKR